MLPISQAHSTADGSSLGQRVRLFRVPCDSRRFPFPSYTVETGNERQRAGNGEETKPALLGASRETSGKRGRQGMETKPPFFGAVRFHPFPSFTRPGERIPPPILFQPTGVHPLFRHLGNRRGRNVHFVRQLPALRNAFLDQFAEYIEGMRRLAID